MHLISVLLPLFDNDGQPLPHDLFAQVADQLTATFGGLTAHTRAPAQGLWQPAETPQATRDEIVIYEVIAESIDRDWWADYRGELERQFRQEHVVVRAQTIELL